MTKFISDGKLTIELVEPRVNLMISKGNVRFGYIYNLIILTVVFN